MKRIYLMLMTSALLLSCSGVDVTGSGNESGNESGNGQTGADEPKENVLSLDADTFYIKADGEDECTFTVRLNGETLTEGYVIENLTASQNHQGLSFSASAEGEHRFMAKYELTEEGKTTTLSTPAVTVRAVSYDVPETVSDPQPENLSFARRVLFTQFTGTGCLNCPDMKAALKTFLSEEENAEKVVLAEAHCGNFTEGDPARLDEGLDQAMGGNEKPHLDINMTEDSWKSGDLATKLNKAYRASSAKAGISVNSVRRDDELYVKISVKVAETSQFRLGAWVLEDGIYGVQQGTTDESYYVHNNCVRAVYGEVVDNKNYSGIQLGNIGKGSRAEYIFQIPVDSSWNMDECHLVVFVTTPNSNGRYLVNNVIDCPIVGQTPYDYTE